MNPSPGEVHNIPQKEKSRRRETIGSRQKVSGWIAQMGPPQGRANPANPRLSQDGRTLQALPSGAPIGTVLAFPGRQTSSIGAEGPSGVPIFVPIFVTIPTSHSQGRFFGAGTEKGKKHRFLKS